MDNLNNNKMEKFYKNPEWLRQEYHVNKRSLWSLAFECGVSCMTISRWLRRHGMPARDRIYAVSTRWK